MTAYLILNYEVTDVDAYKGYQGKAAEGLRIPAECRPLVIDGATEQVEGEGASKQTIVLQFESKEKAREIYDSAEYQAIIGERHGATSNHFAILVDGLG